MNQEGIMNCQAIKATTEEVVATITVELSAAIEGSRVDR